MSDDLVEDGLWISVADLARQKNITRQSAGERVDRLETDGKITVRREGRSKLINLAEYDLAVGEVGDAAREAGAITKAGGDGEGDTAPAHPAYRDHQTREKQYAADLRWIELQKELGRLVPVDQIADAAAKAAEAAIRVIDRIVAHSDTIAAAVAKDGAAGARATLKDIVRETRQGVAEAMQKLAAAGATANAETLIADDEDE
jgi:DNA-binding Lrp family transcriptional regulator